MKIKLALFTCFIICTNVVFAQHPQVLGITPKLYVAHTVQTKETWYSISRLYNINAKELATYNAKAVEKPLAVGEQLKIALTNTNFSQDGMKNTDESLVPVYHIVAEKEWMYRISVNYNKVPIENLEKWNNITRDQAKAGTNLIVGYLKIKTAQSAFSKIAVNVNNTAGITKPGAENKTETVAKKTTTKEVKEVAEKKEPVKTIITLEEKQPIAAKEIKNENTNAAIDFKGGYFKAAYEGGDKTLSGTGNIFRSTSGWNDGKYYALMNNMPVGSIVKISTNGKAVYAKVLGNLAEMKENAGLAIRISNAAAAALGVGENKFSVEVKY
jgi:LysM repeat protein